MSRSASDCSRRRVRGLKPFAAAPPVRRQFLAISYAAECGVRGGQEKEAEAERQRRRRRRLWRVSTGRRSFIAAGER